MKLHTIYSRLRRPLPPGAVSDNPERPGFSSIKGIFITERLNDVFGIGGWFANYEVIEKGRMPVVKCTLTIPRLKITREAFGGNGNEDRGDAYKGACTDALGKAASQIGIAENVYKGLPLESSSKRTVKNDGREKYAMVMGVLLNAAMIGKSLCVKVGHKPVNTGANNTFSYCRVTDAPLIRRLKNSKGKKVELRCRLDRVRNRQVWTVLNIL